MDPFTIAAIAGGLGVFGGVTGKLAHNKYAKDISGLSASIPDALTEAQGQLKGMSTQGLPGFEELMSDVKQQGGTSLFMAKQVASSPSELLSFLAATDAKTKQEIRGLGIQNESAKMENKLRYANFLSSIMAPAQQRLEDFELNKKMGIAREKLAGTSELVSGIVGGGQQGLNLALQQAYINALGGKTTKEEVFDPLNIYSSSKNDDHFKVNLDNWG